MTRNIFFFSRATFQTAQRQLIPTRRQIITESNPLDNTVGPAPLRLDALAEQISVNSCCSRATNSAQQLLSRHLPSRGTSLVKLWREALKIPPVVFARTVKVTLLYCTLTAPGRQQVKGQRPQSSTIRGCRSGRLQACETTSHVLFVLRYPPAALPSEQLHPPPNQPPRDAQE